ncbi:MAG: protein-L-isoaspartate O-methyltransferase [Candidatus Coatesbacteria bacterium]|nr:MAG: protein-L-isoaspartate O-methyltransferase [Candidatus Coatesbacteria bacterium]
MSYDFEREKLRVLSRLRYHGVTLTERMKDAFLKVPREEFVLPKYRDQAYVDTPLPILGGQTISAIHMVLIYISPVACNPKIGDTVLEVGAGSGYQAALFAEMVAPEGCKDPGHVYSLEIIPELAEFAKKNIERTGYADRVTILCKDGSKGYPEAAPFDIISVAAAGRKIPKPLIEQLKVNGRLVIPVGRYFYQELMLITKNKEGDIVKKNLGGVAFVPLTGEYA